MKARRRHVFALAELAERSGDLRQARDDHLASLDAKMAWLPFLFQEASTKEGTAMLANHLLRQEVIGR